MKNFFLFIIFLSSSFLYALPLESSLVNAVNNGDYYTVEKLLNLGANPNGIVSDQNVISPLGLACNKGNIDIVSLLLKHGANPNYVPENNSSPFFYTIMGTEKPEILSLLVDYGLDINKLYSGQNHLAFSAILLGQTKVLKILIDSGLNINIKNDQGFTLSEWANHCGRKDCYEIITNKTTNVNSDDVILIGYEKLLYNLSNSINDNSENPIYINESIFIPKDYLIVLDNDLYYFVKRYLVKFSYVYNSGAFIIELSEDERLNISYDKLIKQDLRLRFIGYATYIVDKVEILTYRFEIDDREIINPIINDSSDDVFASSSLNDSTDEKKYNLNEVNDSIVDQSLSDDNFNEVNDNLVDENNTDDICNISVFGGMSFEKNPIFDINMKIWLEKYFFIFFQGGTTAINNVSQRISLQHMIPEFTTGLGLSLKPFKSYNFKFFCYGSLGGSYLDLIGGYINDDKYLQSKWYAITRIGVGFDIPITKTLLFSIQNCFDYQLTLNYTDHISIGVTFNVKGCK